MSKEKLGDTRLQPMTYRSENQPKKMGDDLARSSAEPWKPGPELRADKPDRNPARVAAEPKPAR